MDRQKICTSNYLIERIGLVEIVLSASCLVPSNSCSLALLSARFNFSLRFNMLQPIPNG